MERLDDDELNRWLHEDAPFGDLTTRSLGIGARAGQLRIHARGVMRVAAIEEAARLFELCGATAHVELPSGRDAGPGEVLLRARGQAGSLIEAWKVAQTTVEAASGLATEAAHILRPLRAAGFGLALACTRKNWPGGRGLAARAVWAGGAVMHRLGLSETLLVFPEHRRFIDPADLPAALTALRQGQPEKRLVVETADADEAVALARLGVDVIQLERFTPEALAALRERLLTLNLRPMLAPAGGVTADNALAYARAGADLLVSSAPYFAPPKDVLVVIEPVA
ncbi:ModD protein [Ideonella sp. A 288]|uniref:ModD protein n=1 Tax=Ideonella sp. A 288 TaxID=1962181 RepID=UPI000B4B50C9|nr:ModD protein [Ideonella sp. A 288]